MTTPQPVVQLSKAAARGVLDRALRRGRELPESLRLALEEVLADGDSLVWEMSKGEQDGRRILMGFQQRDGGWPGMGWATFGREGDVQAGDVRAADDAERILLSRTRGFEADGWELTRGPTRVAGEAGYPNPNWLLAAARRAWGDA